MSRTPSSVSFHASSAGKLLIGFSNASLHPVSFNGTSVLLTAPAEYARRFSGVKPAGADQRMECLEVTEMVGRVLAEWLAATEVDDVPAQAREIAHGALLDTTGVMLAALDDPAVQVVRDVVAADGCRPVAGQLGTGLRTSAEHAALLNGTAAHALDFDDVSASASAHASAVVLPAALAVAEANGRTPTELLVAYAMGLEVVARLGQAIGPAHYPAGWHSTSTLGTLAAAAAAARVMGLDAGRSQAALGIAASMSSGTRRNFGTMTKPLHAGHAARCGVHAARLAATGLTAAADALDGPGGWFSLMACGTARPERAIDDLGARWTVIDERPSVKRYPCCFALHRAAHALLTLRNEQPLDPAEVERIAVSVPPGGLAPLIGDDEVTSGSQARFSVRHTLAAALVDGQLGLGTFTDAAVRRADLRAVGSRVDAREEPAIAAAGSPFDGGYVEVAVHLHGGGRVARRVHHAPGSAENPVSPGELERKFRDCATRALGVEGAMGALDALRDLQRFATVAELVAELRPTGEPHCGAPTLTAPA